MSDPGFRSYMAAVERRFAELETQIERLRMENQNLIREGKVTKLDAAKGTVEVDLNGLPSAELPIAHRAGAVNEWNPPAVGERVVVLSPGGDPGLGIAFPGGHSDQYPAPHNEGAAYRRKIGDAVVTQSGNGFVFEAPKITFKAGGCEWTFDGSGEEQTGGFKKHDGKNVGKDHVHGEVTPGGSDTGVPSN